MKRPSRGERESATTTRYDGRRVEPIRLSRIDTATWSPPECWKARQVHARELSLESLELFHHLSELRVLLEQAVDVLHGRPAAPSDPLASAAVDDLRMAPLARRHGRDDGVEAAEIGLLSVQLARRGLHQLAEPRDHAEDLIERPPLADLLELAAAVLQREGVLAELLDQRLDRRLIDELLRRL